MDETTFVIFKIKFYTSPLQCMDRIAYESVIINDNNQNNDNNENNDNNANNDN